MIFLYMLFTLDGKKKILHNVSTSLLDSIVVQVSIKHTPSVRE